MSSLVSLPVYEPELVPALHRIQHQFGYLQRSALELLAVESQIPLQRIQAVASFFPHFRLTPPKKVSVKVCRDMACHLAGSHSVLKQLQASAGINVEVQGASCLGRCDRAPAACVSRLGIEEDSFYLGRSGTELESILRSILEQGPQASVGNPDKDHGWSTQEGHLKLDVYAVRDRDYAAIRKVVETRDHSIRNAAKLAAERLQLGPRQLEEFRQGAVGERPEDFSQDPDVREAVLLWLTDADWLKGKELGGWSEPFLEELEEADLRGLGGAGIPSAQKLRDVRDAVRTARVRGGHTRAFIVVNGDESEPGTFKDREILLRYPHLIVEAVIFAGLLTEATQGFIYIRHEYPEQIEACRWEIERAEGLGLCGANATELGRAFPISVFVSPGGYICGEQSALIEAMSDRRAEPRNMPPKLETNGLQDLPTIVSNVETYAWMPLITLHGGKAYADLGVNGWKGRRYFSVSGDVKRPGVYEVPMGLTLRELLYSEHYCGGISGERALKAIAPSGPSGGFLPAKLRADAGLPRDHIHNRAWIALAARRGIDANAAEIDILDLELELNLFRALSPTQALGAGMVVYAEGRDMLEQALNSLEFYRNESCGKCVPCRLGSQKFAALAANVVAGKIDSETWNRELTPMIKEMASAIELASICGLGRSVPVPLRTASAYFPEDLAKHLTPSSASSPVRK
ncbi:MAG: NAD(P)H-dependent oxidoreductase subunit E [Verrucomicrobiota bacterium]